MCGIVGMVGHGPVNQEIYDALLLLQHRGQDSTGIATAERTGVFHLTKARGQVLWIDEAGLLGLPTLGRVFALDPFRRHCLMSGLDEIGQTLEAEAAVDRYEALTGSVRPWLRPVPPAPNTP